MCGSGAHGVWATRDHPGLQVMPGPCVCDLEASVLCLAALYSTGGVRCQDRACARNPGTRQRHAAVCGYACACCGCYGAVLYAHEGARAVRKGQRCSGLFTRSLWTPLEIEHPGALVAASRTCPTVGVVSVHMVQLYLHPCTPC